jgi:hypothetical protein
LIKERYWNLKPGHKKWKFSNSGRSAFDWSELYQSAYGIVLALRFAVVRQTGNESKCKSGSLKTTQ